MDRAKLVHVVALVRAAAGVHEREHAGDEQRTLVVSDGKRPGKDGAGFSVLPLAVAEKQRIGCAVAVSKYAALAHEAAGHGNIVVHAGAAADNEVIGNNSVADSHRRAGVAVDASVAKAAAPADCGAVPYAHAVNHLGVTDFYIIADGPTPALYRFGILLNHPVQGRNHLRLMAVHSQDIGGLGAQAIVDGDLAASGLVKDRDHGAVTKSAIPIRVQKVHVLNIAVVANVVVGNIVRYILYQGIVPHSHVVKGDIPQARVFVQPARQGERRLEFPETHVSGKAYVLYIFKGFGSRCLYALPFIGFASSSLQKGDFLFSKIPVILRVLPPGIAQGRFGDHPV